VAGIGDAKYVLRRFAHHARGPASRVANDFAARRWLGIAVDFHECHGALVNKYGVTARMNKHHGMIGRCFAQRVVNGQPLDEHAFFGLPFILVPPATDDPFTGRRVGDGLCNHRHDLGETLCVAEVENQQRAAKARVVPVAFDETGDHHLALQVDDFSVLAAMLEHLIRCTHAENKVIFDRDGYRVWDRLIDCDDIGIDE
jgi:hypothetical protein